MLCNDKVKIGGEIYELITTPSADGSEHMTAIGFKLEDMHGEEPYKIIWPIIYGEPIAIKESEYEDNIIYD